MELLCFFEDGYLEHVKSFAVLDDQLKIVIDIFGILVLSFFKLDHNGS